MLNDIFVWNERQNEDKDGCCRTLVVLSNWFRVLACRVLIRAVCVCGELIGFRVCVAEVQWGCSESSRTPWALSCWPGSERSGSESVQCEAQLIKIITQRCFHFLMSVNVTSLQKTCCGPILNILLCYFLFVGSELWVCCAGFTSRVSNNWVNKSILIMTRQIISRM